MTSSTMLRKRNAMVVPSTKFKLEHTPSGFFLNGAKLQ